MALRHRIPSLPLALQPQLPESVPGAGGMSGEQPDGPSLGQMSVSDPISWWLGRQGWGVRAAVASWWGQWAGDND